MGLRGMWVSEDRSRVMGAMMMRWERVVVGLSLRGVKRVDWDELMETILGREIMVTACGGTGERCVLQSCFQSEEEGNGGLGGTDIYLLMLV